MRKIRHSSGDLPGPDEALHAWAHQLPKIDLHRHLEGSLRLSTLVELASSNAIDLPAYDVEKLRPFVQMTHEPPGFKAFLDKFDLLRRFYTSRVAVQRMTREAIADAALDNVVYLELRFNPYALTYGGRHSLVDVVTWVVDATQEAQEAFDIRVCLILQIPRNEPLTVASGIVNVAIASFGTVVRGIDLAGDEIAYPAEAFSEPFERARQAGLNTTVHAGEAMGAESVRSVLDHLHPQRVGHGIRCIENSRVVEMLHARGTSLEVCPTSNLHTGAVKVLSQHPLVDLLSLGLRVTLNTDDPGVSAITLGQEYVAAVEQVGLAPHVIYRMLRHSVDAAFIPSEEKESLCARLRRGLSRYPNAVSEFEGISDPVELRIRRSAAVRACVPMVSAASSIS
jgi:adenosine deaminase